jgi:mannose-6-phosphate isomerase
MQPGQHKSPTALAAQARTWLPQWAHSTVGAVSIMRFNAPLPSMDVLENPIQPYSWGSRTAIASMQRRPTPSAGPEAELWIGAHPVAPSRAAGQTLESLISTSPEALLGPRVVQRFGARLPFLLKVLAAETPLSLQAHPSQAQAEEGFDDEEKRGVARTAATRNYKDRSHKPELLCALTPFDALCGFRPIAPTLALLDALGLSVEMSALRKDPTANGLKRIFHAWMSLPKEQGAALAERVAAGAKTLEGDFYEARRWLLDLARLYPGDPGIAGATLLNVIRLKPGQAIYLPAGNLHAYLGGVGVEIMASSDNVLRGGLTPKHVDVPELLKVLDFNPLEVRALEATAQGGEHVYETPAPEFRLSRIAGPFTAQRWGPDLLLCTEGKATVSAAGKTVTLESGQAAFIPFSDGPFTCAGAATLYRATTAP